MQEERFKKFLILKKKVLKKNILKPFWKINVEKSIELFESGGWHFNNLYTLNLIKKKIETFPHTEFNKKKFTQIEHIRKKVNNLEDLFGRGHKYKKVTLDKSYPKYFLNNMHLLKEYIL